MPKQTFFNLPQEKRGVIEQAALDEFAEHGYDNSNINRIVTLSKIAKGSFYQYFEDKKDLYFHLMDTIVNKKINALEPLLSTYKQHDFSFNIREAFRIGLALADSEPKYYLLGKDFAGKQPQHIKEFTQKYNPLAMNIYERFLEHADDLGGLRDGIDIPLIASFINTLINETTARVIAEISTDEKRDYIIEELIGFIERAILKNH